MDNKESKKNIIIICNKCKNVIYSQNIGMDKIFCGNCGNIINTKDLHLDLSKREIDKIIENEVDENKSTCYDSYEQSVTTSKNNIFRFIKIEKKDDFVYIAKRKFF